MDILKRWSSSYRDFYRLWFINNTLLYTLLKIRIILIQYDEGGQKVTYEQGLAIGYISGFSSETVLFQNKK